MELNTNSEKATLSEGSKKTKNASPKLSGPTIVKFDCGGKRYKIALDTIKMYPNTLLCKIVDGSIPSFKDEEGYYFIDRDPKNFRHILNFYRYGKISYIGMDSTFRMDLEYFGLS